MQSSKKIYKLIKCLSDLDSDPATNKSSLLMVKNLQVA